MPQILLLVAAGAGLLLAGRRWYVRERARIAAELRAAKEAMEQREARPIVPLEARPPDRHLSAETAALRRRINAAGHCYLRQLLWLVLAGCARRLLSVRAKLCARPEGFQMGKLTKLIAPTMAAVLPGPDP